VKYTFKQFQAEFPDDATCLAKLMEMNYGGSKTMCPDCREERQFHPMTKRRAYACQVCGFHIYPCAGTIFHKSSTKLTNWFFAMYLMTSTRHGVAAKELERQIGCTYKTAWRMAHELRKLMAQADGTGPLEGHVEIDETRIGGKQARQVRSRRGTNKTIVMGMVERGGHIKAGPVPDATQSTLEPIILMNVSPDSIISTDEAGAYAGLRGSFRFHGRVNHSLDEWTRGIHHTNTIEGHWSQLKRSIRGTHVHVSSKHLWKYVSEFSYRRNYRHSHQLMFNRLVAAFVLPRLTET
jgi:transposase